MDIIESDASEDELLEEEPAATSGQGPALTLYRQSLGQR